MNENSARDFIDNFGKMLRGREYQRLNTLFQTELYLRMIGQDFGVGFLRRAVSAVKQHLAYYEKATGNKLPGQRRILERYEHLVTSPSSKVRAARVGRTRKVTSRPASRSRPPK